MEVVNPFVFQVDSDIVNSIYISNSNYLIEYNKEVPKEFCIIYFSSNNIYYPNSQSTFESDIIKKNRFEWYGNRMKGYKHIFLRDIKKQWYLSGINCNINSPEKLLEFLKTETAGFKVIALGSSAGGFASVIYGQLLNAKRIFTFNGQFEVNSLLKTSTEDIDPLLFRNQENIALRPFFDTKPFILIPQTIYYFHSKKSQWDVEQKEYVSDLPINIISFDTKHHGIPFLKSNLPFVLNLGDSGLQSLTNKILHPVIFSIKAIGFFKTIQDLKKTLVSVIQKKLTKYIKN